MRFRQFLKMNHQMWLSGFLCGVGLMLFFAGLLWELLR